MFFKLVTNMVDDPFYLLENFLLNCDHIVQRYSVTIFDSTKLNTHKGLCMNNNECEYWQKKKLDCSIQAL
jgi:hypothetical protein